MAPRAGGRFCLHQAFRPPVIWGKHKLLSAFSLQTPQTSLASGLGVRGIIKTSGGLFLMKSTFPSPSHPSSLAERSC